MRKIKFLTLLLPLFAVNTLFAQEGNVVFSADFNDGYVAEGWVAHDSNNDGTTWAIDANLNGYVYNGIANKSAAEDWLFSPQFSIEKGKHYLLTYTVAQRGAFDADVITISYGNSATPADMINTIVEETYNMTGGMVTRYCHLYAEQDCSYVLGMKITSPANNGIVSLKYLEIKETQGQFPQPVPAMVANMDPEAQTVAIRWLNPRKDTENAFISDKMDALIYEDEELVAYIEGVAPGKECEYLYKPTNFSGKHVIGVSVMVDGNVAEKITKELNYDDVKGAPVPIYTFPLKNKTDFANWVVEDVDQNNSTWKYEYGAATIPYYFKGVNDWLITPGYELELGKRYVLSYELKTSMGFKADLEVTMGNAQNSAAQTQVLCTYKDMEHNGFVTFQTPQFVVETAGTYYFAFHATAVGNFVDLRNVTINIVESSEDVADEELVYEEEPENILPDNINGDLTIEVPYHQRLSSEGIELYAAFTNALIDQYTLAPNGIYCMEPRNNEYYVNLTKPLKEINLAGGAVYNNGKIYCNEYDATGNYQDAYPVWRILDAKTLEVLSETTLNNNCENTTISMAYDATTDKIYGLVKDYVDTWLVVIDPATGAMTRVGDKLDYRKRFLAIGCNVQGELYGVYMTEDNVTGDQVQYLARINKETGFIAAIGQITGLNMMPNDMLINFKMRQSLFFNNQTGRLYWFFGSSSSALGAQYGALFELNTLSANAVLQTWRDDVFAISGAFFVEPNLGAPNIVTNISYTPDAVGSLEGEIKFTVPATSYSGDALDAPVDYQIVNIDKDSIMYVGTAQPGEVVTIEHTATEGIHNLSFVAYNTYGYSPAISYTILVGFDKPAEPVNILLVDDLERNVVLTWDAPELGVNGGVYDESKLTYDVVRYPDEVTVATGLTVNRFEETLGEDMTRYYYVIYSCSEGERVKGAVSNDVVVGAPLLPPYGGIFNSYNDMFNYYTIIDANEDFYSWMWDETTGAAFYPFNYQLAADDWMISPPIEYFVGDIYTLKFSAFSTDPDYLESMSVHLGSGKTPQGQAILLMDQPQLPAIDDDGTVEVYSIDFTVPQSGVYYYGFRAYSDAWQEYLYLYDVSVSKKVDGSVEGVERYNREFDAYYYQNGISVINPNAVEVAIYTTNGILVHTSVETEYNVQLAPGIYIVKSAKSVVKVVVR